MKERQLLSRQVQGAVVWVLRCLELLGVVKVAYPRPTVAVEWLSPPTGLLEIYTDAPCPLPEEPPNPPVVWSVRMTPFQQELNTCLAALAHTLMPVQGVLAAAGIDDTPWTELAETADLRSRVRQGRNAGLDLLLEEDGYRDAFASEDADEVIWQKNAKRIRKLVEVLTQLYHALDRIERAVGPGAVAERVRVATEDGKCFVGLDGERFDVTDVDGAGAVFGLLRDTDGDFVPGTVIGSAVGLKQFKPGEFKGKVSKISRRLGNVIDSVRSKGTRLLLPLPPR